MTQQQQKHTVASPNPRVEERAPGAKSEGQLKATPVKPGTAVKARPMKSKRKTRATKPRP